MKRVVIGGFLALIGSIWSMAVLMLASQNLVSGWSTPPGRLLTTVAEQGMMPVFAGSLLLLALGLILLGVEYFKK